MHESEPHRGVLVPRADQITPGDPAEHPRGGELLGRIRAAWLLSLTSAHTRAAYQRDLALWENFLDGLGVGVLEADREHVDAWARSRQGQDASSTRARRLSALSSFYAYLLDYTRRHRLEGVGVGHNPLASVRRPHPGSAGTRALDAGEYKALLEAAQTQPPAWGPRDAALVALLGMGGWRAATVTGMSVGDLGVHGAHRTIAFDAKGERRASAPLAPTTLTFLDAHLSARRAVAPAEPWEPLLLANDGGRLNRDRVERILVRCARAAGLREPQTVRPHVLRATFATLARMSGVDVWQLQEAMGHSDPRTTQRYEQAERRLADAPTYAVATFVLSS